MMRYIESSPWMDISLQMHARFDDELLNISRKMDAAGNGTGRKDAIWNIKNAFSVVCANAIKQKYCFPRLNIRICLKNDAYPSGLFNPNRIGIASIRNVYRYLLSDDVKFIDSCGGNYDRNRGVGYTTQIRPNDRFIEFLLEIIFKNNTNTNTNTITRKSFDYIDYIRSYDDIFDTSLLPVIRLREGSSENQSRLVEFPESIETNEIERKINDYNNCLNGHHVDIFLRDDAFIDLQNRDLSKLDEFGETKSAKCPLDLISGRKLYRVFNNGKFSDGGRFYGGWWQNIPSDYRRFITIDGIPTVEVDFSSMQLAMLYAQIGEDLEGDAYAINGVDPSYRSLVKTTTFKLINSAGRFKAPLKSELPEGMTWKELQNAVHQRHQPIADYFGSGEGIRLQRLDADIAEDVIMGLLGKGIVALPIHDSFIVAEGNVDDLSSAMLAAYERKMGNRTIGLKISRTLFDELLVDQPNLSATDRYRVGMTRFREMKETAEYSGYRMREEWADRVVTDASTTLGKSKQEAPDRPSVRRKLSGPRSLLELFGIARSLNH